MANYYCDPTWHDGSTTVKAKFLIMPSPRERHLGGFATCETHAGAALSVMLFKTKTVTVHEVSNE
jgi:hypothetical protein